MNNDVTIDEIKALIFTFNNDTAGIVGATPDGFKNEILQQGLQLLEVRKLDTKQATKKDFWDKFCLALSNNLAHWQQSTQNDTPDENQKMSHFFQFAIPKIDDKILSKLPTMELNEVKLNASNNDDELKAFFEKHKLPNGKL